MEETTVKKAPARKRTTTKKETAAKSVPAKPTINKDELIPCINMFAGQTILVGRRTGGIYVWNGLGDVQEVLYEDLRSEITNRASTYIYNPLILVEDERVLELFPNLSKFYEGLEAPDGLEKILTSGSAEALRTFVTTQPKGMKSAIRSLASELIQTGELDSVKKIKIIDEVLGTQLMALVA